MLSKIKWNEYATFLKIVMIEKNGLKLARQKSISALIYK